MASTTKWDIYLYGKPLDSVFFSSDMGEGEVRRSLIEHNGYDPFIIVTKSDSAFGRAMAESPIPSHRRTATKRKSTSRSKPKRAGAKKRTVTRLRRVGGGVRKGHGVFKHGAAPRTYEKGGNEKFTAFAFGHRGNALGKWTASSIIGAMTKANESAPAGVGVTIRGEFTSDGTHHGLGKGRVAMVRENGRWIWM